MAPTEAQTETASNMDAMAKGPSDQENEDPGAPADLRKMFYDGMTKIGTHKTENLFQALEKRTLTEEEQAVIDERVAHQRRMFELFEKREKERKISEILEVCPDITHEEAARALTLCDGREEDAAAALVADPNFKRRVKMGSTPSADRSQPRAAPARQNNRTRSNGPRPKLIDPSTLGDSVFVGAFRGKGFQGNAAARAAWVPPKTGGRVTSASKKKAGRQGKRSHDDDGDEEYEEKKGDDVPKSASKRRTPNKDAAVVNATPPSSAKKYVLAKENSQGDVQPVTDSELKRVTRSVRSSQQNSPTTTTSSGDDVNGDGDEDNNNNTNSDGQDDTIDDDKDAATPQPPTYNYDDDDDEGDDDEEDEMMIVWRSRRRNGEQAVLGSPLVESMSAKLSRIDPGRAVTWLRRMEESTQQAVLLQLGNEDPEKAVELREMLDNDNTDGMMDIDGGDNGSGDNNNATNGNGDNNDDNDGGNDGDDEDTVTEDENEIAHRRAAAIRRSPRTTAATTTKDTPNDNNNTTTTNDDDGRPKRRASLRSPIYNIDYSLMSNASPPKQKTTTTTPKSTKKRASLDNKTNNTNNDQHADNDTTTNGGATTTINTTGGGGSYGGRSAAISSRGHTNRGRVKQKSHKTAELIEAGTLRVYKGWYNSGYIFPEGFKSRTFFRSSVAIDSLCVHECYIEGRSGQYWPAPTFKVVALDRPDEPLIAKSCTGCWTAVLKRINAEIEARRKAGEDLPPPPKTAIAGPEYFGLNQPNIVDAVEALDPEHLCREYWAGKEDREKAAAGLYVAKPSSGAASTVPRQPSARSANGSGGSGGGGGRRAGGGRRRRGNNNNSDSDNDGNYNDDDDDDETQFMSNKWSAVSRTERYRQRCGNDGSVADIDEDNPVPDLIDPITLEPVVRPAISPYGHVMGSATWKAVLAENGVCPFTKQPLKWEQCRVLTKNNIEAFRDQIIR